MNIFSQEFLLGFGAAALLCLLVASFVFLWLRQSRELFVTRLQAELESAHTAALAQESALRTAAETLNLRLPELDAALQTARSENGELQVRSAELEARLAAEQTAHTAQLGLLENARTALSDAFRALSADALRENQTSFLALAETHLGRVQQAALGDLEKRQQAIDALVTPVRESLDKMGTHIAEIERTRVGAYEGLNTQVRSLLDSQNLLRSETNNLVNALRRPNVRGRWGEIQLRRVVELAGMLNYCDFHEQQTSAANEDGARLRPDLLVRLPGGKTVVVDAKAPIDAFLDAVKDGLPEEERARHLMRHATSVRSHVETLTRKAYWDQFQSAPEFVILFLPGENFFSAALEHDPGLIEHSVARKVMLATPTTLIALLRTVFHGWRHEALTKEAGMISDLGRDLYRRLTMLGEHFSKVGASLDSATRAYNQAVGTLEGRVLVTARKFRSLEAMSNEVEIPDVVPLPPAARNLQAEEYNRESGRLL